MKTREYLSQIKFLDRMINNKLTEIYQLKTMVSSISVSNEPDRVQTSPDMDRMGSTVAKIVDMERELDKIIDSMLEKKNCIIKQIEDVGEYIYYDVLFSRYIECKSFEQIAEKMNYSTRQILRIHGKALIEFEKKYGNLYLLK